MNHFRILTLFLITSFSFCNSESYALKNCSNAKGNCPGIEMYENIDGLFGYRNPDDGTVYIEPEYIMATDFSAPYGVAYVVKDGQWHCIDTNGKSRAVVFTFDNGPDYLVNEYRRYVSNDKIGFIDAYCNVHIKAKYDFAWPVEEDGSATVCNGCTIEHGPDEHSTVVNGKKMKIQVSSK